MNLRTTSRLKVLALTALSLLLISGSVLTSCAAGSGVVTDVIDVTAAEASGIVEKNRDNPDFVIMDVRTPEEYATGHIRGATNINVALRDFRLRLDDLERNDLYLVYCRSGNRSAQAIEVMKDLHFEKIYHLSSGISGWTAAGLEVVR